MIAAASAVALVFSAPRLITIGHEVGLLHRTTTPNYYGYYQILRFFHEGIYGRYFEEGRLLGHGMNLSEGLQLVASSALSLFVCLGIARPRSYIETVGAVLFYSTVASYDAGAWIFILPANVRARLPYIGRVLRVYILWFDSFRNHHIRRSEWQRFVSSLHKASLCRHIHDPRIRLSIYSRSQECCF